MSRYAYALFVDDDEDGCSIVACEACGQQMHVNGVPFGKCMGCDVELLYPPGASW